MLYDVGTTASANVTVDENSAEDEVSFNITAFDLAGNSLTVNQTQLTLQTLLHRSNESDPLKSNHIQQQPQHLTCNLGQHSKHHDYCKRKSL